MQAFLDQACPRHDKKTWLFRPSVKGLLFVTSESTIATKLTQDDADSNSLL